MTKNKNLSIIIDFIKAFILRYEKCFLKSLGEHKTHVFFEGFFSDILYNYCYLSEI